ncbi:hypothetical protein [Hyphococcus luteus]|nr:hypothetical protein [Marinicaulis flavus]
MKAKMKFDELTPARVAQKLRQERKNPAKNASAVCIARWEDDGGRIADMSSRRRTSDSAIGQRDWRQSDNSSAQLLMNYASSFWKNAADQLIFPECRKIQKRIDHIKWYGKRLQTASIFQQ